MGRSTRDLSGKCGGGCWFRPGKDDAIGGVGEGLLEAFRGGAQPLTQIGDCFVVDLVGLVSPRLSFPEYLRRYKPKYMIVFPDWFEKFATIDWATNQVVFYDADSVYKYSPFLGVGLRKNTISSRNTMYLYERMGRYETGVHHVPVVVH